MSERRFDALVNYPGLGALWLEDIGICEGVVVGTTHEPIQCPAAQGHTEPATWNFPLSCVRKVVSR